MRFSLLWIKGIVLRSKHIGVIQNTLRYSCQGKGLCHDENVIEKNTQTVQLLARNHQTTP